MYFCERYRRLLVRSVWCALVQKTLGFYPSPESVCHTRCTRGGSERGGGELHLGAVAAAAAKVRGDCPGRGALVS
jgi:hypothetical protein